MKQDPDERGTAARGDGDDGERDHARDVHSQENDGGPEPIRRDRQREEEPGQDQADREAIEDALHHEGGRRGPEAGPAARAT